MYMSDCVNPFNHEGCRHRGWREVRLDRGDIPMVNAARMAADWAAKDLGLDLISVKFFEPGSTFSWNVADPAVDKTLVTLNAGPFDRLLKGKACHPDTTPLPTVWVREGLSPALTAAVVLHEARHVWQFTATDIVSGEEDERDAENYMWPPLLNMGFTREDIAHALQEARFGGSDDDNGGAR